MKVKTIPFYKTGYFSKLICDYLAKDDKLQPFYNNFPSIEGFKKQLEEKKASFSSESRNVLVNALSDQYKNVEKSEKTTENLVNLELENTFTVVTGHQLNLFTGPLYFLYKIISTINLAEKLKEEFPSYNFVPVYWMATEDHDFEEINYFNFKDKKIQWNKESAGPVGRLRTDDLQQIYSVIDLEFGTTERAVDLKNLFKKAYIEHETLTEATRFLANELFGKYGLIIVDGDDKSLKKQFVPFMEQELVDFTSFNEVSKTIAELEKEYPIQVNPREINLFYMSDDLRERIVFEDVKYRAIESNTSWTKQEILDHLNKYPEKFSPNVIMRPLYQEVILPNLGYIGGGGELAYWLELRGYFEAVKIPFPMLLLRDSVLVLSEKQRSKMQKLSLTNEDIFLKQQELIAKKTKELSEIDIDFTSQKAFLQKQFEYLYTLAEKTDKSFLGAVKAQEVKQLKGLDTLEKRLLKAQKRKLGSELDRVISLQNELFPKGSLQERFNNFSEIYLEFGDQFIDSVKESLNPLQQEFTIITL